MCSGWDPSYDGCKSSKGCSTSPQTPPPPSFAAAQLRMVPLPRLHAGGRTTSFPRRALHLPLAIGERVGVRGPERPSLPRHGPVKRESGERRAKSEERRETGGGACLVLRANPLRKCVARMKRSEIRGNRRRFDHAPGLHFVPSGLRKNERKAKSRKQNADRRNWYSAVASATAAPPDGEAHIYRRSTAVLVPRSLSSQGTQPQARLPGTRRDTFCASFERALPAPACPSPAKAPRAPVVVP